MITEKVKNLFAFIDFLHNGTSYFLSKKPLINELLELGVKRSALKPNHNYKDRIEFNKVQAEIELKFDVVQPQTTTIILNKALELGIAPMNTPSLNLTAQSDLFELQRNFHESDLLKINEAKQKYLEYRTKTDCHYFLEMFFNDLDRDLKEFFDYFKQNIDKNEFEAFEVKTVKVNDIQEFKTQLQKGVRNFTMPFSLFEKQTDKSQSKPSEDPTDKSKAVKPPEDSRDKLKKDYLGLSYNQINDSYAYFENFLFKDITFDEYLTCFDLETSIEKYPTFINGNIIKFIIFLDGIEGFKISDKNAFDRFGIKGCKHKRSQGLANNPENNNFRLKIKPILNKNIIKFNRG